MFQRRELKAEEAGILREMLFLAVFVPPGQAPVSRDILNLPQLKIYYENWGSSPADQAVAALCEGKIIGLVWGRVYSGDIKGFGFIDDTDGREVFFHQSSLVGITFDALKEDENVEFDVEKGPKGLQASNVSVV